jgi:hypothetical protein
MPASLKLCIAVLATAVATVICAMTGHASAMELNRYETR